MIGIIIGTHGDFAEGIKQSSFMIFGEQPNVAAVTFKPGEGPDDLLKKFEAAESTFSGEINEVIYLVDLWGGSPFNVASRIVAEDTEHKALVSGVNLPMVIETYSAREMGLKELVPHIEQIGKEGIRELNLNIDEEDDLL